MPFATLGERRRLLKGSGFEEGLLKTFMELLPAAEGDASESKGFDRPNDNNLDQSRLARMPTGSARSCARSRAYERASTFIAGLGDDCPTWRVYELLQELAAPRLIVDKTPPNAESELFLRRAHHTFQAASFVHLVRHPYACIASGVELARDVLGGAVSWAETEALWVATNATVADFFGGVDAPTAALTYEHLLTDTAAATRELCAMLRLPWHAAMAAPYESAEATGSFQPASHVAATWVETGL